MSLNSPGLRTKAVFEDTGEKSVPWEARISDDSVQSTEYLKRLYPWEFGVCRTRPVQRTSGMRYITDLAVLILCVSGTIAVADDRPGGINHRVLAKCNGHGVSSFSSSVHLPVLVANKFFVALPRIASHGKHALPAIHPRIVQEVPYP